MKKLLFIILVSVFLVSCGSSRSLDLNRLTTGMTKEQVEDVAGRPDRVLAVKQTKDGYQEVLEYRTSRREIYALEFWDDYLVGYEFLYDEEPYIPPVSPPLFWPEYGRPIIIVKPSDPEKPVRPGGNTGRPRPDRDRPSTRPTEIKDRPQTKPEETVRPATRPSTTSDSQRRVPVRTTGSERK